MTYRSKKKTQQLFLFYVIMMNFCIKCNKYLSIREEIVPHPTDPTRGLFWYCNDPECDFKLECTDFQIEHKIYQQRCKDDFMIRNQHLNRHKTQDITLPIKKSKCPKCHQISLNHYEPIYFKNIHQFEMNNICSHCYHNWS